MPLHRFRRIVLSFVLATSLLYGPSFSAYAEQEQHQRFDPAECRRLLEGISSPSHNVGRDWRILDLSQKDVSSFQNALAQAGTNDVVLIDTHHLSDRTYRSALESSRPLFTISSQAGSQVLESALQVSAGTPEILAAVPTSSDGVKSVFGVTGPTATETVKYLEDTSKLFRLLKNSQVLNRPENGRPIAETVLERARQKTSSLFILVAHNDREELKFPDGTSTTIRAVYDALDKNRPGIVMSCDTVNAKQIPQNALLTNRVLDFKDIARGLKAAERRVETNPKSSVGDFIAPLAFALSGEEAGVHRTVKIVATVIGSLIVIAALGLVLECTFEKQGCQN
jgi:hypothetical protein